MKILGKHILILGGFYFIISFLLDLGQGYSLSVNFWFLKLFNTGFREL